MLDTVIKSVAFMRKLLFGQLHLSLDLVALALAVRGCVQNSHAEPYALLNLPRGQSLQIPATPDLPGSHDLTHPPAGKSGPPFGPASYVSLHKHCDLLVAAADGSVSVFAPQDTQVVSENVALNLPFTQA